MWHAPQTQSKARNWRGLPTQGSKAGLHKLLESGNGTKTSDEKWCLVKFKYLENKKNYKMVL